MTILSACNLEGVRNGSSTAILAACLTALAFAGACGRSERNANSNQQQEEGRSAQPQSSTPAAAAPQAQDNRPVIVTFGDSLTAGVVDRTYPQYLQKLLDAHGYDYRVENQGVSGDTTSDGLARIGNVIAAKPALVILEFGGNDGLRGVPVEETKKNLEDMIQQLQNAHIPIALAGITLPPNYGPEYVKPFTAIFPELAKKYHLRFVPFLLAHVYQHPEMMQPDGIHPSGDGNKVVAEDVFHLIEPMLKKPGASAAHG